MNIMQSLRVAFAGLMANKLRSSLTMLGIIIGVAAVVSLMSIGRGAEAAVKSQITSRGSNLIYVSPGQATQAGVRSEAGSMASLTLDDANALADPRNVPSAIRVAATSLTMGQVWAGGSNTRTRIMGVPPEAQEISDLTVVDGEFIAKTHVDAISRVAVLGSVVADTLFFDGSPVGQTIRINNQQFRVIGVLASKGGTGYLSQDDVILVPITTLMKRLMAQRTATGAQNVSQIYVQAANEKLIDQTVAEIKEVLRERHRLVTGDDDFRITSQKDMLEMMGQVMGIFTIFLGAIAGISLLVGGIGIMNIMLVSVTERTREIGIRKAVGAKWRDILVQFLIESVALSGLGGIVGILFGWGVSRLISRIPLGTMPSGGGGFQPVVTLDVVLLAFCVAAAVGLFFGIYPANRAARLNPIDALRYE